MENKDYKSFMELMAFLQETFIPDKPVSKQKARIYFQLFKDWTIEKFQSACFNVAKTKTISTFPLPAELIQAVDANASLDAWLTARNAVSQHGAYMSIIFPDPVIHSAIDALGGWIKFCHTPTEELKWMQKDFERLYPIMADRKRHPVKLFGIHETYNTAWGYKKIDTTVKILPESEEKQLIS